MCGIIGIISRENREDIGGLIGHGLYQINNRGDYSAGIATVRKLPVRRTVYRRLRRIAPEHTLSDLEPLSIERGKGKVSDVFDEFKLSKLKGFMGIGHVRYPTAGYVENGHLAPEHEKVQMRESSIQPLYTRFGRIALAHNGDIHNFHELKEYFKSIGLRQASFNDIEVLLNVFSEEFFDIDEHVPDSERVFKTVSNLFKRVSGTYSCVGIINNVGIVAFRDFEGRRPLFFGVRRDDTGAITDYAFASETVALEKMLFKGTLEFKYENGKAAYDEVCPGEIIFVAKDFTLFRKQLINPNPKPCPFEAAYFMRASSYLNNKRVKRIRQDLIENMWDRFKETSAYEDLKSEDKNIIITPVPRTAEAAAIHLSNITGFNYSTSIEKHPFSPRIFLQPTQEHRDAATIGDHYIFSEEVAGKIVIVIDDSIVRGTTMKRDIKYLKDLGAREIHLFITFPPIRNPCMHAIDFHTKEELFAQDKSLEILKEELGLEKTDSLIYARTNDLLSAIGLEPGKMCNECYKEG